jgi:hypothetical protein
MNLSASVNSSDLARREFMGLVEAKMSKAQLQAFMLECG